VAATGATAMPPPRTLGSRGPEVPRLGLGGAWVQKIPDSQALGSVEAAWGCGTRYFDTAPWYGKGLSEHRISMALHGLPRTEYQISTKVGRTLRPVRRGETLEEHGWSDKLLFNVEFDYSWEGIMKQHAASLQRLGCGYVDALVIHDMEQSSERVPGANPLGRSVEQHMATLEAGGFRALQKLRADGAIACFGAGLNADEGTLPPDMPFGAQSMREFNQIYMRKLVDLDSRSPIDFFLMANIYTLLEFSALDDGLLGLCLERGIGVVIGGPFSSGILADPQGTFNYARTPPEVAKRATRMRAVCEAHGVPLGAAALQFPFGHPAVSTVIPGARSAEEARQCAEWMALKIPDAMWAELKHNGLVPERVPLPSSLSPPSRL
jgi:D-threo-aldose 1-dehydrogenase